MDGPGDCAGVGAVDEQTNCDCGILHGNQLPIDFVQGHCKGKIYDSSPLVLFSDGGESESLLTQYCLKQIVGQGEYIGSYRHAGHCRYSAGARRACSICRPRFLQHAVVDNQQRHLSGYWRDIIWYERLRSIFCTLSYCHNRRV